METGGSWGSQSLSSSFTGNHLPAGNPRLRSSSGLHLPNEKGEEARRLPPGRLLSEDSDLHVLQGLPEKTPLSALDAVLDKMTWRILLLKGFLRIQSLLMKETWGLNAAERPHSPCCKELLPAGTHSLARSEQSSHTHEARAMKLSEREWQGQARKIEVEVIQSSTIKQTRGAATVPSCLFSLPKSSYHVEIQARSKLEFVCLRCKSR